MSAETTLSRLFSILTLGNVINNIHVVVKNVATNTIFSSILCTDDKSYMYCARPNHVSKF